MRGFLRFGIAIVVVVACGAKKDADKHDDEPVKVARFELGDCATVTVPFVSGPRPLPFAAADSMAQGSPTYENVGRTAGIIGSTASGFDDTNIYGGLVGNEQGDPTGGGYGKDAGSGGGGWGTIGTGRYGTIGHGAGTGGYGVGAGGGGRGHGMRGRMAAVPTISIGQPATQGDLDKAIIRRYIKRNLDKFRYCYEKQLLATPGLQGTVSTQFFIAPNGTVASANASGVDPAVAGCVADVIKGIEFPKPRGGGGVQVNYPFTFRPAGGDTVPLGAIGFIGTAGSNAGSAAQPDRDPNKIGQYNMKPEPTGAYVPGATSPLHDQEHALIECVRALHEPYGVMVVDLTYDAAGGVATATESGIADKTFASCVEAAAKKVKRTDKTATAQRCGAAFGVMPMADAPTIAITATDVTWNGAIVDHVKDIVADPQPGWRIPALFEALDAWTKHDAHAAVRARGPGLLEPLDATPMRVVSRALSTAYAAGVDFVLAVQRNGAWQPLREVVAPVVPVPLGTGVSWNGLGFGAHATYADDETVKLSILVDKDHISVGLSRIDEIQDIAGRDWAKLEATLKEHKASAFFADRTDIEIAGTDAVTYGDVAKVIDLATRAGFSEWRVTDPDNLSTRPH